VGRRLSAAKESNVKDVSNLFDHYRISACSIWNTAFWPIAELRDWDCVDQFDEIKRILFDQLVLFRIGRDFALKDIFRVPISFFHVVPAGESSPVMIQNPRPNQPRGYWDHPLKCIGPQEAEMYFVDYFDWNRFDFVDFQYYRVIIAKFDAHPELAGREALIERMNASVHLPEGDNKSS
jgi:hypothetical protein